MVEFFAFADALSGVEGLEVNVLGLTFGINPFDPSLKLPLVGRIGPERQAGTAVMGLCRSGALKRELMCRVAGSLRQAIQRGNNK